MNGFVPEYTLHNNTSHKGTIAMFPTRPDVWREGAKPMQQYMCDLVTTISRYETVYFFCQPSFCHYLLKKFENNKNVEIIAAEYDDIWARDIGPSFIQSNNGIMTCVDWRFNAWGGRKQGAYYPWDKDDFFAYFVSEYLGLKSMRASIVVEGGGIITDGVGTIFTTRSVLMNRNRNPFKTQSDIERELLKCTNASRVVWLEQGLAFDETDGHIDNIMSFISSTDICLAWTNDKSNPNYERLDKTYRMLAGMKNVDGDQYIIHRIPLPDMQYMTKKEENGICKSDNTMERRTGDILPASYVNFYMLNGAVLIPSFGCETDAVALEKFKEIFSDMNVIQIYSREPLLGGGGIHCLLHEVPDFNGEPAMKSVLSRKVKVRGDSKIDGYGMFAEEPIKKGEIVHVKGGHILSWFDVYSSKVINSYLPISDDYVIGARIAREEKRFKCYINHSCNPNCGMDGEITFVAMRDIAAGEELTIDYAFIDDDDSDAYPFECKCGRPNCRHVITGRDWKKPELQKKYEKRYFAKYLQEKMDKIKIK